MRNQKQREREGEREGERERQREGKANREQRNARSGQLNCNARQQQQTQTSCCRCCMPPERGQEGRGGEGAGREGSQDCCRVRKYANKCANKMCNQLKMAHWDVRGNDDVDCGKLVAAPPAKGKVWMLRMRVACSKRKPRGANTLRIN